MTLLLLRVAALRLLRDPLGLAMTLALPPLVFLVFAAIFAGASAGRLELRAGLVDLDRSAPAVRFAAELDRRLSGRLERLPDAAALRRRLADGELDAGLVLKGPLDGSAPAGELLSHPGRRAAALALSGEIEAAARDALAPELARRVARRLAPALQLTPAQRALIDTFPFPRRPPPPFVTEARAGRGDPLVTYYAGAVSMLFLMFAAAQNGMVQIDERASGLGLRLAMASGGAGPLVLARFLWLTLLGFGQTAATFLVAAALYGAPTPADAPVLIPIALLAAASGAGLALALVSACATREQAQTASTVLILTLAAVGGAMAPRFLMPAPLRALGWATPHAWAIEAYQAALWPGRGPLFVLEALGVLGLFAGGGLLLAIRLEGRRRG